MHKLNFLLGAVVLTISLLQPAAAHHLMDGQPPETLFEGFLSGLFHPIIGLDHLTFVVTVGIVSALTTKRLTLPLAFVVTTSVGTLGTLAGISIPILELLILLSLVVFGFVLISGKALSVPILVSLFALSGFIHGSAYGETILGAETSSLIAYIVGFTVVQYLLAIGSVYFFHKLWQVETYRDIKSRMTGVIIASVAVLFVMLDPSPFLSAL